MQFYLKNYMKNYKLETHGIKILCAQYQLLNLKYFMNQFYKQNEPVYCNVDVNTTNPWRLIVL